MRAGDIARKPVYCAIGCLFIWGFHPPKRVATVAYAARGGRALATTVLQCGKFQHLCFPIALPCATD
jgi:hypothetical protein